MTTAKTTENRRRTILSRDDFADECTYEGPEAEYSALPTVTVTPSQPWEADVDSSDFDALHLGVTAYS